MSTVPPQQPLADDVEELRRERDALRARVAELEAGPPRRSQGRLRSAVAAGLVALTTVMLLAATVGVWVNRNLLTTSVWMERVGPLIDDPAVQDALAGEISTAINRVIDPAALFQEVLPERGKILAAPLGNAVEGFVADQVRTFVGSDQFRSLWLVLNERAHAQAVATLRGENEAVTVGDKVVTISLVPAINEVLRRLTSLSPEILGRRVQLPTITADDIPQDAVRKLADALGIQLPADYAVIRVYDGGALETAQQAVERFDRLRVLAIVLTLVLVPLTLVVSHRRRRTALQLLVGAALVLVALRRAGLLLQGEVTQLVKVPVNRNAASAVVNAFIEPMLQLSATLLWGLAAVAAVLVLTGPYPWAVRVRRWVADAVRGVYRAVERPGTGGATAAWLRTHRTLLQVAGAVVAVGVMWLADLSWLALAAVVALVGLYELILVRATEEPEVPEAPDQAPPATLDAASAQSTPPPAPA